MTEKGKFTRSVYLFLIVVMFLNFLTPGNIELEDTSTSFHESFQNVQQDLQLNSYSYPNRSITPNTVLITNSGNMAIPQSSSGNDIIWEVSGLSAQSERNVNISRNDLGVIYTCDVGGCWGTVKLSVVIGNTELSSRSAGIWTYTLKAWGDNETLDPQTESSVIVTIVHDDAAPIFSETPTNQTLEKGSIGNIIRWNATDRFPNNYIIFGNNSQIDSGTTWSNSTFIEYTGLDN